MTIKQELSILGIPVHSRTLEPGDQVQVFGTLPNYGSTVKSRILSRGDTALANSKHGCFVRVEDADTLTMGSIHIQQGQPNEYRDNSTGRYKGDAINTFNATGGPGIYRNHLGGLARTRIRWQQTRKG